MIRATKKSKGQSPKKLLSPYILRIIGENFRQARVNAKLSQIELGQSLGVTQQYVGNIEQGRKHLSVESLFLFAGRLGIEPGVFFKKHGVPSRYSERVPKDLRGAGKRHLN